jgi:hypothetical protein
MILATTVWAVTACTLPLPGTPISNDELPSECRGFAPGAQLVWAGHGHPEDFGLLEQGMEPDDLRGDIFVEAPRAPEDGGAAHRQFCVLVPSREDVTAVYGFGVPAGWAPP